jgi:hypothetical protein
MNSQQAFHETAIQVLKTHGLTPDTIDLKHNETKTFGNITFKFTGICRYYDLYAKPLDKDDKEYVCIKMWRD